MKKLFILLIITVLVLCLSACGDGSLDTNSNEVNNNKTTENIDTAVKKNDDAVNINKEVTVEMVEKAPVTDESFFNVVEVDGGVSIEEYTGTDEIVVIPEEIGGKPVVEVEDGAFVNAETVNYPA